MLLTSSAYFVFLVAIFALYWPLARWRAASLAVILAANYFFYAKWDPFYLVLIPAASTCDYLIALRLGRTGREGLRRALVGASIAINVGMLVAFKYMPFVLENWAAVTGAGSAPKWEWTFPLGISFYAFQALTYTIDVYRRDADPNPSLLSHLAAVSFFPTTLAGPITRVADLVPQLERKTRELAASDGGRALFLIGLGLIKKFLIADYLADNLVNRVFDFPKLYSGMEVLIGAYAYAFQLYFDFSGYTDIALGSALLVGLKLPQNFNQPYLAINVADFWRRWHISLSNWLRDYLYFSLPGLRSRWKILPYLNLVITMLIGGLWHGPSWNFVVWGGLHGVALAVTRAWQTWRGRRGDTPHLAVRILSIAGTFNFVCLAWIFFRAATLDKALEVLDRIASLTVSFANISVPIAIILAIGVTGHYLPKRWLDRSAELYAASPFVVQALALAALVLGLQFVATTGAAPFIYTKF
jgi:alginate O-acetyltransferase complex protein AlgI